VKKTEIPDRVLSPSLKGCVNETAAKLPQGTAVFILRQGNNDLIPPFLQFLDQFPAKQVQTVGIIG
jgi:hypothetical protein